MQVLPELASGRVGRGDNWARAWYKVTWLSMREVEVNTAQVNVLYSNCCTLAPVDVQTTPRRPPCPEPFLENVGYVVRHLAHEVPGAAPL